MRNLQLLLLIFLHSMLLFVPVAGEDLDLSRLRLRTAFAVRTYDSEPEKIVARLARRDAWMEAAETSADWIGLMFDSRNDDRTAFVFTVNAAGVKIDTYIYDDDNFDLSWDGVWDVAIRR